MCVYLNIHNQPACLVLLTKEGFCNLFQWICNVHGVHYLAKSMWTLKHYAHLWLLKISFQKWVGNEKHAAILHSLGMVFHKILRIRRSGLAHSWLSSSSRCWMGMRSGLFVGESSSSAPNLALCITRFFVMGRGLCITVATKLDEHYCTRYG